VQFFQSKAEAAFFFYHFNVFSFVVGLFGITLN